MSALTDTFDLAGLNLTSGEGKRLALLVAVTPLDFGGQRYAAEPDQVEVQLDISRMTSFGYSLRLRFETGLVGPCMRCLEEASVQIAVDTREVDQPGGGEDLESPYVLSEELQLATWAHDAFALAVPAQVQCRPDCAGLCAICAANLNEVGEDHHHRPALDPRWAKLGELKLE